MPPGCAHRPSFCGVFRRFEIQTGLVELEIFAPLNLAQCFRLGVPSVSIFTPYIYSR